MFTSKFRYYLQNDITEEWIITDIHLDDIEKGGDKFSEAISPWEPGFSLKGRVVFTGMLDKTGKEVYEGDIIKEDNGDFYGVVRWGESTYMFYYTDGKNDLSLWEGQYEIIGNIYENPKLLTEG